MSRFCMLGYGIRINGKDFQGKAVASEDTIFLALKGRVGVSGQGVLGHLIQSAINKMSEKEEFPYQCPVEDLPDEVTSDPEWPLKNRKGDVVVLPRSAIKSLKLGPWFYSLLSIKATDITFKVAVGVFSRRRIRRFLTENGWTL